MRPRSLVRIARLAVIASLALPAVSLAAGASGPASVTPGKPAEFKASGLAAKLKLSAHLQPTQYRGGNGFGRLVELKVSTDAKGAATVSFKWPKTYGACSGGQNCRDIKWDDGERVDVVLCTTKPGNCTKRVVVRVRNAK